MSKPEFMSLLSGTMLLLTIKAFTLNMPPLFLVIMFCNTATAILFTIIMWGEYG